jgi:hypothetical protein
MFVSLRKIPDVEKLTNELQTHHLKFGGRDRARTCDPLLAKQVLSQLSYTPTAGTAIHFMAFGASRKLQTPLLLPTVPEQR